MPGHKPIFRMCILQVGVTHAPCLATQMPQGEAEDDDDEEELGDDEEENEDDADEDDGEEEDDDEDEDEEEEPQKGGSSKASEPPKKKHKVGLNKPNTARCAARACRSMTEQP